jgi:hypothetical protein
MPGESELAKPGDIAQNTGTAILSAMGLYQQLEKVRRTTSAASRALPALPHSSRAAAVADEQFVYRRPAALASVFAPAASRRLLNGITAEWACFLVVSHGSRI